MATSSSAELKTQVESAGIAYLPAEQVFYKEFPYKVELSPKFKGLGGVRGKRSCMIDITDPVKGREQLEEFNQKMEKIFKNVEHRNEIREYVSHLPDTEFKARMGGENSLFYFKYPKTVLVLVEKYSDVINSVTGPISSEHENVFRETNLITRTKLYYNHYRYFLEFPFREDFYDTAQEIYNYLKNLPHKKWRGNRLESCIRHYETIKGTHHKVNIIRSFPFGHVRSGDKIQLYLEDGNDFIYIKMMAAEKVLSSHEVVLVDELT